MKDKIIEIWDKIGNVITTQTPNMTIYYDHFDAASETADMVQKFVEWLTSDDCHFYPQLDDNIKPCYWDYFGNKAIYFDELFTYWHKNIYNIKDK